ncbi:MAG TPA: hypothetical protein VJL61_13245 [Rhodanobacteraceae bacterium]|nr:hypothetical protein [Rhodanobacteraceae bacterium]
MSTRPAAAHPPVLLYWLAHIPWHGDIFGYGEPISQATRGYGKSLLGTFRTEDVIKLLSFIDPEAQIGRGTLGQSVEAIVSSLPHSAAMLRTIVGASEVDIQLREYAALILAMNEGESSLTDLALLESAGSWYAGEIANHVKDYGGINPYA